MLGIFIKLFFIIGFFLLLTDQNSGVQGEELSILQKLANQMPIMINGTTSEILKWAEEVEEQQGYDASVELYTGLLHYYETTYDADNPTYITLLKGLGRTYANGDQPEKALSMAWKIYRKLEKIYGKEHMHTVNALLDLGKIYRLNRKYKKAEEVLKRAYKLTKAELGQNHRDTIEVLFELANVYRKEGDSEDWESHSDLALRYYQKVYDVRSKDPELGETHEETLVVLINIGDVLFQRGELLEATKVLEKVLEIRKKTLGELHPLTQEVKNHLFRTLSKSGKTQRAKKVLGELTDADQNPNPNNKDKDKEDESFFTLAEGKAHSLAENGKHVQALEILSELYEHEILKGPGQISPKIFNVLNKLVSFSKVLGDFEQTLKWANIVIDLFENQFQFQSQFQKQKVNKHQDQKDYENIILVFLKAIKSAIDVFSEQNDENKIEEYFEIANEVMKGQNQGPQQAITLVDKFLAITSQVADFKIQIGKTTEAFTILNYFVERYPRGCTSSICGISLMIDIAVKNDDYKIMEIIALKFFSMDLHHQKEDKKVEKIKQPVREFLVEYLFSKANDLVDLQNYEEAFSLYKTVEKIWTEAEAILPQDKNLTPNFLERISNAALMINKFEEALFYFGKIKEVFKNRLINEPEMDEKERAAIARDISKVEKFQESLKTKLKTPNFQKISLPLNSNKGGKFKKIEL